VIVNIQVLRAVAAVMVVCDHILFDWHHDNANTFPHWLHTTVGSAGVDLFFVISGFIMLETTREGQTSPMSFLRKRLIRIAPLYWMLVIVQAIRTYKSDLSQIDLEWLAQSLLFLPHVEGNMQHAAFPSTYFPILFVGWTLIFEMFFYAIFAIALTLRRSRWWPFVVPVFFLAMMAAAHWLNNSYLNYYDHPIILEFLYGMAIAAFPPPSSMRRVDTAPIAAAIVCAGFIGLVLGDFFFGEMRTMRAFMYGIPAAAIVYGATRLERRGYVANNRLLLSIGAASYSLYLIHPFFLSKLQGLLVAHPPAHFLPILLIYIAAIGCTIALALLSYSFFERPAQRYLTRLFDARKTVEKDAVSTVARRPWAKVTD
jgi:exopolysaccharide production protein ExoZ